MAVAVVKTAYVYVVSTDLTAKVQDATLTVGTESVDSTAMTNGTRVYLPGLKTAQLEVTFLQDFSSSVDALLGPLVGAAAFNVEVRPTNAGIGATNPRYYGNWILESYTPISGKVGEMAVAKATFKPAGDITRATS
jgi:hypothetical protein